MITVLLIMANQEPVKVELDELPPPDAVSILCRNPRDRRDKEVDWIEEGVNTVIIPWSRINSIQVLPSADDQQVFPLPFRTD